MINAHLTIKSSNAKTGPIPVTTTSADTCPSACPFNHNNVGGCYAASGPLAMHWRKVSQGARGTHWNSFCQSIAELPDGQLWRHNQAGDLPGNGSAIDFTLLDQLIAANRGKKGFTYTHYNVEGNSLDAVSNRAAIKAANNAGFTINLSANNLAHADKLADLGIAPVTVVLPIDQKQNTTTENGRKVVVCPATIWDEVSCATCQMCQRQRYTIIGFPAHGTGKKKAEKIANGFPQIEV